MRKPYIFFLFVALLSVASLAQEQQLAKANKNFEQLDYIEAQKIYLAVAEKGFESEELYTRLANSFYFNAQYAEAERWYKKLIEKYPQVPALTYLRYSQVLKAVGKDALAKEYFDSYAQQEGNAIKERTSEDYMEMIDQNSDRYSIMPLESLYDENSISFGHTVRNGALFYATNTQSKGVFNRTSGWDGLPYLSLQQISLDDHQQAVGDQKDPEWKWRSRFHQSSPIFTEDGKTLYFTSNNLNAENKKYSRNLKIYRSRLKNGKWQDPEDLSINSDLFSTAHPALNPSGDILYFASDRPGGYGQSDIYSVTIDAEGNLGNPKNLGQNINTAGKETFPYVSPKKELYFSSDGHFGLGGLDVFYTKITPSGPKNLLNVGRPINSYADDFSFGFINNSNKGFVSSNRSGTKGEFVMDNIYTFTEIAPIKDLYLGRITGKVTDLKTGKPIARASITARPEKDGPFIAVETDSLGNYQLEIQRYERYWVKAEKPGYDTEEKISIPNKNEQVLDFQLQPNRIGTATGTDLSEFLNIPNIYFDYDKATIRQDAEVELQKLVAVMEAYPNLGLDIRSHTDSRGNSHYNLELSQRRAKATAEYLIQKGINPNRLTATGKGESELINDCSDGVDCSEADHQKNRRSEFLIQN